MISAQLAGFIGFIFGALVMYFVFMYKHGDKIMKD